MISSLILLLVLGACSYQQASVELDNIGPGKEVVVEAVEVLQGDQFEALRQLSEEYLANASFETILPQEVFDMIMYGSAEEFVVVDIRDIDSFANGYIQGAVNIPYANTADPNRLAELPKDAKIIIACFSGHTAGQTAALWNMLGYNAVVMEYGMGAWNAQSGLGAALQQQQEFDLASGASTPAATNSLPTITTEVATDMNSLIMERSREYLNSGSPAVVPAPRLNERIEENDSNLFVVDTRDASDYGRGTVPTAINIPLSQLATKDNLAKLPLDKQIVLVGYDGADASKGTRVLAQLGYDAVPLHSGIRVWNPNVSGITGIETVRTRNLAVANFNYNLDAEAAAAG